MKALKGVEQYKKEWAWKVNNKKWKNKIKNEKSKIKEVKNENGENKK